MSTCRSLPLLVLVVVATACADDSGSTPQPDPQPKLAACRAPQWIVDAPGWGVRCRSFEDCPNPTAPTTFCELSTGGYCTELSGPDWGGEGQPCASDANSIGFTIGSFRKCLAACTTGADCRPGYACAATLGAGGNVHACLAIADCDSRGCNDAGAAQPYYCDTDAAKPACWIDRCVGTPCGDDDFSSGSCARVGDLRRCDCVAGEPWDPDCQRCGGLVCDADDLGRVATVGTAPATGTTCGEPARFDPTANGCTGWDALGPDSTFQLTLAPQTGVTITATPLTNFDIALYVVEDCFDFSATGCLFGEDAAGAEVVYVANDSDADWTVIAVVDGAGPQSCGDYELTVEPFAFQCVAEDLGTFSGTAITRAGASNCAGSKIYNPGLGGCTRNHAAGSERIYRLTLAPSTTTTVTMSPSGFDASLWEITRCGDYGGAACSNGSDTGGPGGNESITLTNSGVEAKTHFIVADSFDVFGGCGTYDLTIQ